MGTARDTDLPAKLGAPARRALVGAGYLRLEQLAGLAEADVKKLHGMGPHAIRVLEAALEERGMSFRQG